MGGRGLGRSLQPRQRNMDIEGMGAAMLKGPGENTDYGDNSIPLAAWLDISVAHT